VVASGGAAGAGADEADRGDAVVFGACAGGRDDGRWTGGAFAGEGVYAADDTGGDMVEPGGDGAAGAAGVANGAGGCERGAGGDKLRGGGNGDDPAAGV